MSPKIRLILYKPRLLKSLCLTLTLGLNALFCSSFAQVSTPADTGRTVVKRASGSLDKPIDYKAADSIIFNLKKNRVYLYRNASVVYGDMDLKAHYIEIDLTRKEIFAKGGFDSNGRYTFLPVLKDGDDSYTADSMRYNSNSKKGRVYGLRLKQDETVIHLTKVLKNDDGSFVGERGKITTCTDDHPHFYFNANRVKVIPNNKALFGSANLVVEDVPTPLGVPFGLAPLKKGRRNGILFPAYGYNQFNKSFYLQNLGYYMGLGPHADLSLSTDAYLNGDLRLGVTSNIIKRYKYRSNINLGVSWFGNGQERTSPLFERNPEFSIRGGFNIDNKLLPGINLNGDINMQTGNFNRLNSRDINNIANQQFQSSVNFGKTFLRNRVNLTAAARHMQNTATRDFRLELPTVNLGVSSLTPFARKNGSGKTWYEQLRLSYNMQFSNVINTKDSILFSRDYKQALQKTQTGINHSIPINTNVKLLKGIVNMSPSLNYRETWYFRATDKTWDTAQNKVETTETTGFHRLNSWDFNTGFTTNIYGTFQGLKAGKIRSLRHTITPTLNVGYRPEINAALRGWQGNYRDSSGKTISYNRFEKGIYGGGNSQERNGYVGFGINNNLQGKKVTGKDSTGKETLEKFNLIDQLSISGSYNFFAEKLKMSDIGVNMNTVLMKNINITARSSLSIYDKDSFAKRVQRYQWDVNKMPVRMRNAGFSLNTRLTPEMFSKKAAAGEKKTEKEDQEELEDVRRQPDAYYRFDVPWSLAVTYVFDYNAEAALKTQRFNNRLNLSGDISITPEWKIGYTTGYDFMEKRIASSQFNVARNLHCWQIEFSWIPSGFNKYWAFSIRPKSGLLQDLRLNRRMNFNPVMF